MFLQQMGLFPTVYFISNSQKLQAFHSDAGLSSLLVPWPLAF